jgi:hypothetical protein
VPVQVTDIDDNGNVFEVAKFAIETGTSVVADGSVCHMYSDYAGKFVPLRMANALVGEQALAVYDIINRVYACLDSKLSVTTTPQTYGGDGNKKRLIITNTGTGINSILIFFGSTTIATDLYSIKLGAGQSYTFTSPQISMQYMTDSGTGTLAITSFY